MPDISIYTSELYEKWKGYWKEKKIFSYNDKDAKNPIFVMDMPPPNTTGGLHLGHVFWTCYGDSIARYKKMKGFNLYYPVGWDEHGFPTEIETEKQYGKNLPRNEFYAKCLEVSQKNLDSMKEWMSRFGAVWDEKLEYRTTDKEYIRKVQLSLLLMYEKEMLYRNDHPIEWCVSCGSAISREQAEEKEEETYLNYIDFKMSESDTEKITIATTRPEMLHSAVAIAVNPKDDRYSKIVGKEFIVPIFGQKIKVVTNDIVDKDYGTGVEMICTFGDKRDISIYYKNKLNLVQAIDSNGKLINAKQFNGININDARNAIADELKKKGVLKKQEKVKHNIKVHDRCLTKIELISTTQWFIKIREYSDDIKRTAKEIKWVPESARQRLDDWANFIEWDWAFTRNRIFGTPMPFWYCEKCNYIVPPEKEDLPFDSMEKKPYISKCPKCSGRIVGTKETLDGWVDTSITSMVLAGWPDQKKRFEKLFPNSMRIQGTDIVRTWAFYTIFRTMALTSDKPWNSILVHGMILGQDGKEMHKSLGNGIYPDGLVEKYSIDAIRLWVALSGGIGRDRPFSYNEMDYAKSFITKLYNTANFVNLALSKGKASKEEPSRHLNVFDLWILNRLNETVKSVTDGYDNLTLYEAMNTAINFYWHEFADFYIENVKHRVYSTESRMEGSRNAALYVLKHVLETSIAMFAPVIPFISEEIYLQMKNKESVFQKMFPQYAEREKGPDYVINGLVQKSSVEFDPEDTGIILNDIISEVRKGKAKSKIALNKEISSININVPEQYYSAVVSSKEELKNILKAVNVSVKRGKDFSVSIAV